MLLFNSQPLQTSTSAASVLSRIRGSKVHTTSRRRVMLHWGPNTTPWSTSSCNCKHTSYTHVHATGNKCTTCRQDRKVIYPGRRSNLQPTACKSGAQPTELLLQFCLRFDPIYHSELSVINRFCIKCKYHVYIGFFSGYFTKISGIHDIIQKCYFVTCDSSTAIRR